MAVNTEPVGAVCLLSGGMDSTVTLAHAIADTTFVIPVHVTYGQRTALRERRSFDAICDHYDLTERIVVALPHIAAVGGSSLLTGGPAVPDPAAAPPPDGIPSTYVPFRNGMLLAIATGVAEVRGARRVYIGAVEEDSSGYPDCRETFFAAFNRAIEAGTRPDSGITIVTPVLHASKADIVRRGMLLGAPFHCSWSCYRSEDVACGRCDSCALRRRAFRTAGVEDPIPYREG